MAKQQSKQTVRILGILLMLAGNLALISLPAQAQEPGDPYADEVVSFMPGELANPDLGNPETVLGPPDFNQDAMSGFLNLGIGGSVTVAFVDNLPVDGPGTDIRIHGDPGNDERWIVEVSLDGRTFLSFDDQPERTDLDLADVGLPEARFVRLTDDADPAEGVSPGAELDAVEALNPVSRPQAQEVYLRAVEPPEGRPGEELELALLGGGFGGAEEVQVIIGGLQVLDAWIESDEVVMAHIFIPEDAPSGHRPVEVVAIFGPGAESVAGLEAGFFVLASEIPPAPGRPALYRLEPRDVEQGSEVELTLFGDNLTEATEVLIGGEGVEILEWGGEDPSRLIVRIEVSPNAEPGPRLVAVATGGGRTELRDGLVVVGRPIPPAPSPTPTPVPPPDGDWLWPWAGATVVLVGAGAAVGRALTLRTQLTWKRTAQLQWQLEANTELPEPTEACRWACKAKATTELLKRWKVTALELAAYPQPSGKTPPVKRLEGQILDPLTEAAHPQYILEDEAQIRRRVAPVADALLQQILAWKQEGGTPASIKVDARLARDIKCEFKLYHCETTGVKLDWADSGVSWKGTLHQPGGKYLGVLRGPTADEPDFPTRAREELEGLLLHLVKGVRFKV